MPTQLASRSQLAFAACELAVQEAVLAVQTHGVAMVGVVRNHHCGVLVDHLRPAGEAGMLVIGFANSPAALPMAGGRHRVSGTNPVAAIFPQRSEAPLMIDMSLSEVARQADGGGARAPRHPCGLGTGRWGSAHH